MSIFAIVYPGHAADPVMTGSIDVLSLVMLGLGVLGIVITLLMVLKPKRSQPQSTKSRDGLAIESTRLSPRP